MAAAILLIAPITGGSLNPARTFGPYLAVTMFGGSIPWSDLGVYLIGPVTGGIAAVLLYDFVAQTQAASLPAEEEAFTPASGGDG